MTESFTAEETAEPRVYTIEEVADLLDVSPRTVRRAIEDDRLKAVKVSPKKTRVTLEAIREFLEPVGEEAS